MNIFKYEDIIKDLNLKIIEDNTINNFKKAKKKIIKYPFLDVLIYKTKNIIDFNIINKESFKINKKGYYYYDFLLNKDNNFIININNIKFNNEHFKIKLHIFNNKIKILQIENIYLLIHFIKMDFYG